MNDINFNDLKNAIIERGTKYFYYDKAFNKDYGMNYNNYIKLRYDSINFYHMKDYYTIKGWYILWWLMCNAQKTQYIETTLNIISNNIKINVNTIKELLLHLHKIKVIKLSKIKNITNNTHIEIIITYNNNNYYNNFDEDNIKYKNINSTDGYTAIPIDYIKPILKTIDYKQFAILSVLLTKYSYFSIIHCEDAEGKIYYKYDRNHYAFPTYFQLQQWTGISSSAVERNIKKLIENKYDIISYYNDHEVTTRYSKTENKFKPMMKNNIYYISLFEQIEFVYYHIYKVQDNKPKSEEFKKKLNNKNFDFEKEAITKEGKKYLSIQDYIKYYFKMQMELMNKYIKQNNEEGYKKDIRPERIKPGK